MNQICPSCKQTKSLTEFYVRNRPTGKESVLSVQRLRAETIGVQQYLNNNIERIGDYPWLAH